MASVIYNVAKGGFADGTLDWDTDTIEVLLLSAVEATPDPDHADLTAVLGDAENTEVTTVNYARQTVAGRTVAVDNVGDRAVLDADDQTWTAIGDGSESAVSAVVFRGTLPIALIDFTDTVLNGGDFTIQWSTNGVATLS